jgi:DNA polymerase III epsilon subunit-like protein
LKRPLYLKPRGAEGAVEWEEFAVDAPDVGPATPLDEAEFVALDIETTGNRPFLVLEVGAERFRLAGTLAFFDTLVDCRAPINPYARRRHQIDRSMLIGAPEFGDVRSGFLRFAKGAVLVEHSHDAFDTWLVGRGLNRPLGHPIVDTTALARLVLGLPGGQTPGLSTLVQELAIEGIEPAHAALSDARATAAVFRELVARARRDLGWTAVGDVVAALPRPEIDRSGLEGHQPPNRKGSSASRAGDAPAPKAQPLSGEPAATQGATSRARSGRRGRSSRRRRSGSSGSPGGSPA